MEKKKSKKVKQTRILVVLLILIAVAIGVCVFMILKKGNGLFSGNDDKAVSSENAGDSEEIKVEISEDFVEPGADTLDISKIQGFTSSTAGASENASVEGADASGSAEGDAAAEAVPAVTLSDPNLTVEAIGSYTGNFLEDGSDEPTANVAAMLVTNNSERMLQIADITFQVNDTETASFRVTNLPAGTTVLVLESNKREFKEEDSYTYGETASGYMDQPTLEEDKFELVTEEGKITLKNNTDQAYEKVYVYYKYVQLGGAYLGGITYRTPFENVPAGGEVEAVAGHFNPDSSKIMAVQILEE